MHSSHEANDAAAAEAGDKVKVWDPVVRVFHWTVVAGVFLNLTVLREVKAPHRYIGYAIAAALLVRVIWGFVGSRHARFNDFIPTPRGFASYVRALGAGREPRYIGHNPAGAVMMAALMALILIVSITGWMMGTDQFWGERWVEDIHEVTANLIVGAAALHVAAAVFESLRHGENLVWSMVTGYKRKAGGSDIDHANFAD